MRLEETLRNITNVLIDKRDHWNNHPGLLSGYSGVLLYFAYFNSKFQDKRVTKLIGEHSLKFQDEFKFDNLRYSDGLSGSLWAFKHLSERFGFSHLSSKIYYHFLNEIYKHEDTILASKNLDLLHGLLGLQLSLECLADERFSDKLDSLVLKSAINHTSGAFWYENFEVEAKVINTSMAHGQASYINYLSSRIDKSYHSKKEISDLIYAAIEYLLSTCLIDSSSQFPSIISTGEASPSRLAWCYGDLSVACAILFASYQLHDNNLKQLALRIASETINRKSYEQTGVIDLGFCHGSSGLIQLYSYFYRATGDSQFQNASTYWLDFTLSHLFNEGPLYKAFDSHEKWQESYGLLNGLAGIGLTLISYQFPNLYSWEEAFYLKPIRDGKVKNIERCHNKTSIESH